MLVLALATKGFWLESREVRSLIDDENTRANRSAAMTAGFVAGMLAESFCTLSTMFEPIHAREAIHVILSLGIGAALLRFGMLERRAHKDG